MKKINWDNFKNDDEALEYLISLPRYKNNTIKSALSRALFFLSILYCRIFRVDKPVFIVLVTNEQCNLKCTYCYGNYGQRDKYENYSTRYLLKIIDELKELGTRLLTLHGGESLLRRDIGEVINYAKLRGFYISLNTNGYLIPNKIKELICIDNIILSLDGREENNDKNRGKGCYKKVMEAIDFVLENNIPLVIHATLTKNSIQDMEFLAKLAQDKKFRVQYSILYNYAEFNDKCPDTVASDTEIRETVKKIWSLKKKGYPIFYSENVLTTAINWPFSYNERFFIEEDRSFIAKIHKLLPCYHGKLKYQIDADGRVVTCWAHNIPDAPNIKEIGVAQAIKQCRDNNKCRYCTFLANNEHNALIHLIPRNIWNIICIQIADVLKIKTSRLK